MGGTSSPFPRLFSRFPDTQTFIEQPDNKIRVYILENSHGMCPTISPFLRTFMRYNTECKIIDGGMTPLIQFIDTHVNKPFKDILKERWAEWIASGTEEFTKQGNRRRASL